MAIDSEMLVDYFKSPHTSVPVADLQPALSTLLQDVEPIREHRSKHRLLHILYRALQYNDFALLVIHAKPAHAQVFERRFLIDLPQHHLGLLFGAQGRHIKALNHEFDTRIKVEVPRQGRMAYYQHVNAGVPVVLTSAKGTDSLLLLQRRLEAMAARIKLKRELHNIRVGCLFA